MRKPRRTSPYRSLAALLTAAALLLSACAQTAAPLETPANAPDAAAAAPTARPRTTPAPTPTPCPHAWQDGVCALCGERCPHEEHDPESAVCLLCGEQRWHCYEHGVCTGCGREPLLYTGALPAELLTPSETPGAVTDGELRFEGRATPIVVWTPADYDAGQKYDVLVMLPGDNGDYRGCISTVMNNNEDSYCMASVYDHMAERHLCAPFIVVGVRNFRGWPADQVVRFLCEGLLPFLAERYATWADDGSEESLIAARDHFALGGTSRGSMQVYELGMGRCLPHFANFGCFSCMTSPLDVAEALEREENLPYAIRCYVASWGTWEPRGIRLHQYRGFNRLVEESPLLTKGENAFGLQINAGHNWIHWGAAVFDALQYFF